MQDLHEAVLVSLRRIIRATDLHSRRLGRDTGLTTPQLVVLRTIAEQGAPAVSEIARNVSLSQATVTTILNRLQSNGLVQRRRSRDDKRRVNVHLSADGERLLETAPEPLQDSFIHRFSSLQDWEQHLIVAALDRVAEMMDAESLDVAPLLTAEERFG